MECREPEGETEVNGMFYLLLKHANNLSTWENNCLPEKKLKAVTLLSSKSVFSLW